MFYVLCFTMKGRIIWAEKSVFCCKKGGHFQTGEQSWVPYFPVSEAARDWTSYMYDGFSLVLALYIEKSTLHITYYGVILCDIYVCDLQTEIN